MSSSSVIIRYDGPALAGHQMDVADLAPALLGVSELCTLANQKFNDGRAAIKVLIGADQEHKCFQLSLDVVQTLWQQAQTLIGNENVKSARDILDWLGLIKGGIGAAAGAYGLIKLIRLQKNRKITETKFSVKDGQNIVEFRFEGDNNVLIMHQETYELMREPSALNSVKKIVQPLTKPGYDKVEFEVDQQITERVTKDEVDEILDSEPPPELETPLDQPQTFTAWVKVYAPVYDMKASAWRFEFGDKHERMDITETPIAEDAIRRGGVLIDDTYKVILELQQSQTPSGQIRHKYKIKQVLEFHPAKRPEQTGLFGPST